MSKLSLASSRAGVCDHDPSSCFGMLGIGQDRLCGFEQGKKIVLAHNGKARRRRLDFTKRGFRSLRHAYGAALGWILGDMTLLPETQEAIATAVGKHLEAFWRGDFDSGVIVLSRRYDSTGTIFVKRETCGGPLMILDGQGDTLLVPTEIAASGLGGGELYERIDLMECHTPFSDFSVADIFFTGADGESIAGLGDIDACLYGIRDVHPALIEAMDADYELFTVNRRIGSSWTRHLDVDPQGSTVCIPMVVTDDEEALVSLVMERVRTHAWEFRIEIEGESYCPAALANRPQFSVAQSTVIRDRKHIENVFLQMDDLCSVIKHDTILDAKHLARLPEEFVAEVRHDRDSAIKHFDDAVMASFVEFRKCPTFWPTTQFVAGREKGLRYSGSDVNLAVQMLIPLYLTEKEKLFRSPSVYAVAEVCLDPTTGEERCSVPSILGARAAVTDVNNLRRAIVADMNDAA